MKQVTKSFVCGNANATPGIAWCFPGDKNCNNYCNFDHSRPMADAPKSFDAIEWEEKDMWQDVIILIAEYVPKPGAPTVYDQLMAKYKISEKYPP